jgi:hypothetical protein
MLLQTRWRRRKILSGRPPFYQKSHLAANIAQHFRRIGNGKSLIGGDGINKTVV